MNNAKTLAIIVPCYNEEAVIKETSSRLLLLLQRLTDCGKISAKSKIVFVDDGSNDSTWAMIETLHANYPLQIGGVKLAANAGHQNALIAGLSTMTTHADMTVTIDADLQDDINAIEEMVDKFNEGIDIVYGVRKARTSDSAFKRVTALGFYRLMRRLGVKSIYNHADFRLMSRRAVNQLLNYPERNLFLRGIVPLVGYKTDCVYYDRAKRFAGESKYPLGKMINFALDGITSFSTKPLRYIFLLGIAFIVIAFVILVYILVSIADGETVRGWASLMVSMWFIGGCILIGLGISAEYIGKIYIEVKQRPRYNIEKVI